MKYCRPIVVAFLLISALSQGVAQKPKAKIQREIRKVNRISDPEKAIVQIEGLIPKLPTKLGQNNYKVLMSLRLADLFIRTGEYLKAEVLLISLVEEVRLLKPKPIKAWMLFEGTVYDCYERLGYFYLKTGNLRKAEQLFSESKSLREGIFPVRSAYQIQPIAGIGALHFAKGEFEETYRLFNEAEKLLNQAITTGYDYDNVARLFLNDLAELCLKEGRQAEAWEYINKLSIASSGLFKFGSQIGRRVEVARIFELKARYFLFERNFPKAQEYLNRANQYYPANIASSEVKFKLLKTEALLNWFQGNTEKSNVVFLSLIKSYRHHISQNFISMSEYEKEQFYNTLKGDFNLFNAYVLNNYPSDSQILFEEIFNNALNTKALLLNETNKIKNNIIRGDNPDLISKLHQWEQAKTQLSSSYFDKNAVGRIDSLERKIEMLEKEINRQSQLFMKNEKPFDWKQVKATLKNDEAAIEILRINTIDEKNKSGYVKNSGLSDSTVYLAMILKPDSDTPQCVLLPNGNRLEKRSLAFYRNSIFVRVEDKMSYDQFWLPLKKQLKGIKRVYLSPDGVFNQINLNTLKNPVSQEYLLDEIEVVYLTNTADLLREEDETEGRSTAVLIGRPSYDFKRKIDPNNQTSVPFYGKRNVITDELESFKEQDFIDLPGTEIEITEIEEALKGMDIQVQTFKGQEALEKNVKAIDNPVLLHIATHGFFVDDAASHVNPMIRSGLILAGVKNQNPLEDDDGILTAYEATNLNLEKTSLVALSACETGLGEVRNGEGVYGLQRAIIVAGANNLLMSLWKVDDKATAALMSEMYKAWKPGDNQSAFRNAQKKLRLEYPDPFFWGAFIMLGK